MTIKEALNQIDHKCIDEDLHFYDFRSLYEAVQQKPLSAEQKTKLSQATQKAQSGRKEDLDNLGNLLKVIELENSNDPAVKAAVDKIDEDYFYEDAYTSDELWDKYGTTDLDIINAGNEEDVTLKEDLDISSYQQLSSTIHDNGNTYALFRKREDNKTKWAAAEYVDGSPDLEHAFEITYDQARGFEPLSKVGKISKDLGKKLLPKNESIKTKRINYCPHCTNNTLEEVEDGYYVCDECGAEYTGYPAFEGGLELKPVDDECLTESEDDYYTTLIDNNDIDVIDEFLNSEINTAYHLLDYKSLINDLYNQYVSDYDKFPSSRKMDSLDQKYSRDHGRFYKKWRPVIDKCKNIIKLSKVSGYGIHDAFILKILDQLKAMEYNFPYGWKYESLNEDYGDKWAVYDSHSEDLIDVYDTKELAKEQVRYLHKLQDDGMFLPWKGPFFAEPYYESLKEASYGGAYDIEDDMFFTKEEIVEFADDVINELSAEFGKNYFIDDIGFVDPTNLYISIEDTGGYVHEHTFHIDMRRIRSPKDIYKYKPFVLDVFKSKFGDDYEYEQLADGDYNESLNEKSEKDPNKLFNNIKKKIDSIVGDRGVVRFQESNPFDFSPAFTIKTREPYLAKSVANSIINELPLHRNSENLRVVDNTVSYDGTFPELRAEMSGASYTNSAYSGNLKKSNSTSGVNGVTKESNGKYKAYVTFNKVKKTIGRFDTLEDAQKAREEANKIISANRSASTDAVFSMIKQALNTNKNNMESLKEAYKHLNNREKQVYIDIINNSEECEDIDDLKDIVHEIFFYDKALFAMMNKFPKDASFEELKANKIAILKDSMLDESLKEDLIISPEKEYQSKSGHRILIKDVTPYMSEYDGTANLRIKYDYKLAGSDEWGSSECNQYDLFKMLNEDYERNDDSWGDPYSFDEVERELKKLTNNWSDEEGTIRCYYEQEKQYGMQILKKHYDIVEPSDGRTGPGEEMSWVIAYSSPKEQLEEGVIPDSANILDSGYCNKSEWNSTKEQQLKKYSKDYPDVKCILQKSDAPGLRMWVTYTSRPKSVSIGESYLIEDIAAVKRQYSHIPENDFDEIIRLDPTFNPDKDSVGKYGKWLLGLYKKDNPLSHDNVTEIISQYDSLKNDRNYQIEKDINKFKSFDDMQSAIESVSGTELSSRQKERELRTSKDYKVVYKDEDWTIYVPLSYAGSCTLGKGTRWCTAYSDDDSYYKDYTEEGPLYIIINNHDKSEKYQFHFETESYMNKDDDEIDIDLFLSDNPSVCDFFENSHLYAVPQEIIYYRTHPYIYDGNQIPDDIIKYIKSIEISDSVTEIRDYAFDSCISLKSIEIPSSITNIGSYAFNNCTDLKSIEIPNSVTDIPKGAFIDCESLELIKIPDSVTEICRAAFANCKSLKSIEIPNSVTKIEEVAFYNCKSLESINIPDSVDEIGRSAFAKCESLRSIEISNSVTRIEYYVFEDCTSLESIKIPNSVTEIWGSAFDGCTSLKSIEIHDSVDEIGMSAFRGCSSLSTLITVKNSYAEKLFKHYPGLEIKYI